MMRNNRGAEVLMADILIGGLRDIPLGDDSEAAELEPRSEDISLEEIGLEQILPGFLNESQLQACMDPLEYIAARRDPAHYGDKSLGRNLRIASRRKH